MQVKADKLRVAGQILIRNEDPDVAEIGNVLKKNADMLASLLTRYSSLLK